MYQRSEGRAPVRAPAPPENEPRMPQRMRSSSGGALGWWYTLSAPAEPGPNASFETRERARRGHLASLIILGLLVVDVVSLPAGFDDRPTLMAGITVLGVCLVAIALNRGGLVTAAGLLLVAAIDLALVFVVLSASGGQLDLVYLPLFDLLVISLLLAVSLLPPASVFAVAAVNAVIIVADLRLQPATPALHAALASSDGYTIMVRPVALQFIVALVAFLWVRSALIALRRADRAEEIAELERREVERKVELEEGVRELLRVHVHLANGDFAVRTPQLRNPLLWQIGISLNNLIARLARAAQGEAYGGEGRPGRSQGPGMVQPPGRIAGSLGPPSAAYGLPESPPSWVPWSELPSPPAGPSSPESDLPEWLRPPGSS